MANYQSITLSEMLDTIRPDKGWVEADPATLPSGCKERVYDWPIPGFSKVAHLRVYTSISLTETVTRPVGADAIRVCAVAFGASGTYGYIKAKRVHRVTGWAKNIRERLLDVYVEAKNRLVRHDAQKTLYELARVAQVAEAKANQLVPATDFLSECPPDVAKFKGKTLAWAKGAAATRDDVALEIMLTIYSMQTADEQDTQQTVDENGVGFSGVDAEFMSSLSEQYQLKHWLSPKQVTSMKKVTKKYAGQYIRLMKSAA
jgi:hypothetical protein